MSYTQNPEREKANPHFLRKNAPDEIGQASLTRKELGLKGIAVLPLVFSSRLNTSQRDELESLMFFHPQQDLHASSINTAIMSYGFPKIVEEDATLRIGIEGLEVQTLYAFVERGQRQDLVGVLVYTRICDDTLVVLHMAVRPEFCYSSGYKNELVLIRILAQLRAIAKRIRGIKKLSILYSDKEITRALV